MARPSGGASRPGQRLPRPPPARRGARAEAAGPGHRRPPAARGGDLDRAERSRGPLPGRAPGRAASRIGPGRVRDPEVPDGGPAAPLLDREFLGACQGRLNRRGVFAINVWNRPRDDFPALFAKIGDVFGSNTSKLLLSEAYRNAIVFGFEDFTMPGDLHAYREAAKALRKKHLVNFPLYLRRLYWQNFI